MSGLPSSGALIVSWAWWTLALCRMALLTRVRDETFDQRGVVGADVTAFGVLTPVVNGFADEVLTSLLHQEVIMDVRRARFVGRGGGLAY